MLLCVLILQNYSRVRKDNIDFNNNRIEKANNENEVWKIVKDVACPKDDNNWSVRNESGVLVSDNENVANLFNNFFKNKIDSLKDNIDKDYVENPTERLEELWNKKNVNSNSA